MRAPKLKKFAKKVRAKVGTRAERVATRQRRKTSVVTAKQKGKRARQAERAKTKSAKGPKTGWLQEKLAQDQAGSFEDVSIAFDPATGEMAEDWSGGGMESGYGAMVEPITEKAWFWPALIGGAAAIYFFTMKKK